MLKIFKAKIHTLFETGKSLIHILLGLSETALDHTGQFVDGYRT